MKEYLVSRQYLEAISSVRETQGDEVIVFIKDDFILEVFNEWEKCSKPKKTDLKALKRKLK